MIRILFADESSRITSAIMKKMELEDGLALCGTARDGEFAFQEALRLQPDIAVIDSSLPGMDGLQTTELLSQHLPYLGVILTSLENENDAYRHAMLAGAREFLQKPYRAADLIAAVRRVYEFEQKRQTIANTNQPTHDSAQVEALTEGSFITVLSGKGGSGKSTLATNFAIDIRKSTGKPVILIDLSLQFGDIGAILNLPSQRTIVDLATSDAVTDMETIQQAIVKGPEGIDVLLAPVSPEQADYVTTTHLRALVENLRHEYSYIIADTTSYLSEITLDAIEMSDTRVIIFDPSVAGAKNARLLLSVLSVLNVDTSSIVLVSNNRESTQGLPRKQIEDFLHMVPSIEIPYDPQVMVDAQLTSIPLTISAPNSISAVSIHNLTRRVLGETDTENDADGGANAQQAAKKNKRRSRFLGFANN